ncbi:MAG: 2-amino-4-hydroxy-6-hydroxymethyldihydropteridine diphosphokinase [Deltaproteobacteria bacterium]|jgi:2-amino-4-hydroxy-6-hydroxymethyldihydropteridine diphosphokinase|nr:2-amino-4-hydroxy-6-hydroxymethyldihydropteridine diphosphokinase [Deltaproteobacteria bacterium]
MRRGGEIVYVAVGANVGDREATLGSLIRVIEGESEILLLAASPVFETDPVGPPGQGAYLNAALRLRTWLSPSELLGRLQRIEGELGRIRGPQVERWGPRTLDLDILFYGERCIEMPDLVVPHPRAHERAFVMRPMAALDPDLIHPRLGITMLEIVRARPDAEGIRSWRRPAGWPGG